MKRRERLSNLKRFIASIGYLPGPDHTSFISINFDDVDPTDEANVLAVAAAFKKTLSNAFGRRLPGCCVIGHVDLSDDEKPALHGHVVVYHPDQSKDDILDTLRSIFTGRRAVCLSKWYGKNDHTERDKATLATLALHELNLTKVTGYSIKVLPEIDDDPADESTLLHGESTARIVGNRLLALVHLRRRGMMGGRIAINLSRPKWKWHRDVLVNSETGEVRTVRLVTELMKRKKKAVPSAWVLAKKAERKALTVSKPAPHEFAPKPLRFDPETGEIFDDLQVQSQPDSHRSNVIAITGSSIVRESIRDQFVDQPSTGGAVNFQLDDANQIQRQDDDHPCDHTGHSDTLRVDDKEFDMRPQPVHEGIYPHGKNR